MNHVLQQIAFFATGLFVCFYLAYRLMDALIAGWGSRLRIHGIGDWASLPMLLLLFSLFSLAIQPVSAGFSRSLEHDADVYGLEVIHGLVPDSPQVGARAFQKLGEKALSYPNPHPFYVAWVYSHPPIAGRLRFAASYQPWNTGQTLRYVK